MNENIKIIKTVGKTDIDLSNLNTEDYSNGNDYQVSYLDVNGEYYSWEEGDYAYPFFILDDGFVTLGKKGTTHEDEIYDNLEWKIVGRVWHDFEDETLCKNPIVIIFACYYDANRVYIDKAINDIIERKKYDKNKVYFSCYEIEKLFKENPVKLVKNEYDDAKYQKCGKLTPAEYHFYRYPYEENVKKLKNMINEGGKRLNLSDEERKKRLIEYQKEYQKKRTEQRRKEKKIKQQKAKENEQQRQRRANMTLEQKEEYRKKQAEYKKRWRANMSQEKKEAYNDYQRQWRANMAPEKKEERKEYQRQWRTNMPPEEKEEFRKKESERNKQWRDNMSPEEKEEYRKKKAENTKKWRENKKLRELISIAQENELLSTMTKKEIEEYEKDKIGYIKRMQDDFDKQLFNDSEDNVNNDGTEENSLENVNFYNGAITSNDKQKEETLNKENELINTMSDADKNLYYKCKELASQCSCPRDLSQVSKRYFFIAQQHKWFSYLFPNLYSSTIKEEINRFIKNNTYLY